MQISPDANIASVRRKKVSHTKQSREKQKEKECNRKRQHTLLEQKTDYIGQEHTQTNFGETHTRTYLSWHQLVNTDSLKLLFTRLTQLEMVEAQGQVSEYQSAKEGEKKRDS